MNRSCLGAGIPVVTAKCVGEGEMTGSGVDAKVTKNRRPSAEGTVEGFVPEQLGDVWLVKHVDGSVAPYHHEELHIPSDARLPRGFRK